MATIQAHRCYKRKYNRLLHAGSCPNDWSQSIDPHYDRITAAHPLEQMLRLQVPPFWA